MPMRETKNTEIEVLRAISIIFVLIAHSALISPLLTQILMPIFHHLSFGMGVDLFFCISGYVVAKSYVTYFDQHRQQGRFRRAALAFWLRRAYRLLPSSWFWVSVVLLCSVFFNQSGVFLDLKQNLISALSIASFTANVGHIYQWTAPNAVHWSLSLEEQFYFLLPFFLLLITQPRTRIWVLILVIAVQFPLTRHPFGEPLQRYFAMFRIDGFAWGILIFYLSQSLVYQKLAPKRLAKKPLAVAATCVLLGALLVAPGDFFLLSFNQGVVALIAALLVWLASYEHGYVLGGGANKLLLWLGSRSYALYLTHIPAHLITFELATRYLEINTQSLYAAIGLLAFSTGLALVLSELNFRWLEEPVRKKGAAKAKQMLALATAPSETSLKAINA